MSWADTVKATALAALAERTVAAGRTSVDAPWIWNPQDVWLTRARQPRDLAAPSAKGPPVTPARQDSALRD
jgi:hypothetical protein